MAEEIPKETHRMEIMVTHIGTKYIIQEIEH